MTTNAEKVLPIDPLLNPQLVSSLSRAEKNDPEMLISFWFAAGTTLKQPELNELRWEHVQCVTGNWTIKARFGSSQWVQASVAPAAAQALEPYRQKEGRVLKRAEGVWSRDLRFLLRFYQADLDSIRESLGVERTQRKGKARKRAGHVGASRQNIVAIDTETESQDVPAASYVEPCAAIEQSGVSTVPPETPERSRKRSAPAQVAKAKRRLISAADAAALLSMSDRWVKDKVKAGELVGYRLGKKVVVELASIDDLLAKRRIGV